MLAKGLLDVGSTVTKQSMWLPGTILRGARDETHDGWQLSLEIAAVNAQTWEWSVTFLVEKLTYLSQSDAAAVVIGSGNMFY